MSFRSQCTIIELQGDNSSLGHQPSISEEEDYDNLYAEVAALAGTLSFEAFEVELLPSIAQAQGLSAAGRRPSRLSAEALRVEQTSGPEFAHRSSVGTLVAAAATAAVRLLLALLFRGCLLRGGPAASASASAALPRRERTKEDRTARAEPAACAGGDFRTCTRSLQNESTKPTSSWIRCTVPTSVQSGSTALLQLLFAPQLGASELTTSFLKKPVIVCRSGASDAHNDAPEEEEDEEDFALYAEIAAWTGVLSFNDFELELQPTIRAQKRQSRNI